MRDRMSPRALLRRVRAQLPDTLDALQQVPRLLNGIVHDAAQELFDCLYKTRARRAAREIRVANARRDATIGAAALWLSGLLSLALFAQHRWFGLGQMGAGILLLLWYRTLRSRSHENENPDRKLDQLPRPQFAPQLAGISGICRSHAHYRRFRGEPCAASVGGGRRLVHASGEAGVGAADQLVRSTMDDGVCLARRHSRVAGLERALSSRAQCGACRFLGSAGTHRVVGSGVFRRPKCGRRPISDRCLWLALVWTLREFAAVKPAAAWMMLPFVAWVSLLAALNLGIWRMNQ